MCVCVCVEGGGCKRDNIHVNSFKGKKKEDPGNNVGVRWVTLDGMVDTSLLESRLKRYKIGIKTEEGNACNAG